MHRRFFPFAIALLLVAVAVCPGRAASPEGSILGGLAGIVTDAKGGPQLGAAVSLIASDGRVVRQVYTDERGAFIVGRVLPGIYSLRVTLASFLPTFRENILIEPGADSFLAVNLASLFNAVDVFRGRRAVADSESDWTWVLRTSGDRRPVLRYGESEDDEDEDEALLEEYAQHAHPAVLSFSGGMGRSTASGSEADFNTSFALANHVFRRTDLLLSGNVGYERQTPATAFRLVMRREMAGGSSPEVAVTVRQIFLPGAFWRGRAHGEDMQSLTVAAGDRLRVADSMRIEYGFLYDSINFLERLNSFSPYGRLIYEASPASSFQVYYTEGAPRMRPPGADPLRTVASDLAVFPRLSMRDGAPAVQRGRHLEFSYTRQVGGSTVTQVGVYRDEIRDLALTSRDSEEPAASEFLPDVFTGHYSYNSGDHQATGVRAAVQRKFSDQFQATLAYSYGGVLAASRNVLYSQSPEELRGILEMHRRHALSAKLSADVPRSGTRIYASYKWVMGPSVSAGDIYDESLAQAEPNLNLMVRQPLPSFIVLPGRVEAMADFRNLLAQGYVPIITADGRRLTLVQNVRSFRGGFTFNF